MSNVWQDAHCGRLALYGHRNWIAAGDSAYPRNPPPVWKRW